jgi:DNA-directed RNA polymerase subunit M/transcription elongation factor TFIIS
MIECPECGHMLLERSDFEDAPERAQYCSNCGAEVFG